MSWWETSTYIQLWNLKDSCIISDGADNNCKFLISAGLFHMPCLKRVNTESSYISTDISNNLISQANKPVCTKYIEFKHYTHGDDDQFSEVSQVHLALEGTFSN